MYQRRPADPTNPGDAADLSIMGYYVYEKGKRRALAPRSTPPRMSHGHSCAQAQ